MVASVSPAAADETSARLTRTVASRLSVALDDADLVSRISALGVPWLLADAGRVRRDKANRLHLDPEVGQLLEQLGRSMAWISDRRYHHGQQASETATKAMRAIRTGRIDMDGLLQMAARFRSLRHAHVRRNSRVREYAPREAVPLVDGTMLATRVVSLRELNQLGQEAGNCLAWSGSRTHYAWQLKQKLTAFWRIDPAGSEAVPDRRPTWVIAIDQVTDEIEELEHAGATIVMPRDREALIEFLTGREGGLGETMTAELARFLISPVLIRSVQARAVKRLTVRMAGVAWVFEIGAPGVLVALPCEGSARLSGHDGLIHGFLLHGAVTRPRSVLSVCSFEAAPTVEDDDLDDNEEDSEVASPRPDGGMVYMCYLAVRVALRQACAGNAALRTSCLAAFAEESPLFLADWFGIVPATRPGILSRRR